METEVKIGQQIGYLNPKTGRYSYGTVVQLESHPKTGLPAAQLRQEVKQGRFHKWVNLWHDETENIIRWSNEQSKDWKTPKTLVKIK